MIISLFLFFISFDSIFYFFLFFIFLVIGNDFICIFFFLRFFGGDYFYNALFKLHVSANNGEAALKVLKDWDERKFSRLPKQPFETLIDLFIKNEKFSNALEVIQMFKDNDNHMIDIEVRLLLKENDINSILDVFREAAILKMNISENVCIIVARKIFELIEKEKKNIEILKDKYSLNKFNNNNVEIKIKNFDNNVINNVENNIENNFIENINNSLVDPLSQYNRLFEISSISNNLLRQIDSD